MATSGSQEAICRLVKDRTIELEMEAARKPDYNGVVVTEDMLLVVEEDACNLQLYRRLDGKLMSPQRLEDRSMDVYLISKTEVAVCLADSTIVILSFKSIDDVKLVKTLNVRTGLYVCHSVAKLNSDKLVVSGVKWDDLMLYWCVVNLTDGRVDSTHKVCKGGWSQLAIKNGTVYISCWTSDPTVRGVYAFDIFNPRTRKFLYQHIGFIPGSIMVDEMNFIYVCDLDSNSIHQLTDSGQLVTIHTVSSRPIGIFYDDQHGVLYTTSMKSNVITLYRLEYSHEQVREWDYVCNFPLPYKDICQTILANQVNLTRRQGRPLLNPDQCQIVFPDPQGKKIGRVGQFDLSLLYTLIRNISTVLAPLTAWGNDPQDQPRDSSLGASVERIHSYRNHISGHSAVGKINQQDFEDYWNKFEAVIHDIESVTDGQVYSQELEK